MQNSFLIGIELIKGGWYQLKKLWDKDGAQAGLAGINEQQNARAAEIAKARGVLQSDLKNAQNSLTWQLQLNDKSFSSFQSDIKKKLGLGGTKGIDAVTENAPPGLGKVEYGKLNGDNDTKAKADGINSGGQRSIIINIGKQIEKIEQHIIGGGKEAADEIETAVKEAMKKVYYSLNNMAS